MTDVINVAIKLNESIAAVLTKEDERQMPAADTHFPEERDEMPQEIRSVPKRVINKPESPQTAEAAVPESGPVGEVRGTNMWQTDAEACVQEGLADWSKTDTSLHGARNPNPVQLGGPQLLQ